MQDRLLNSFNNFIENPVDKPFFLQMSFKTPHVQDGHPEPFQAPSNLKKLYKDWTPPRNATDSHQYFKNLPLLIQQGEGQKRYQRSLSTGCPISQQYASVLPTDYWYG